MTVISGRPWWSGSNRQVIGQAKIVKPVEGWNNDRDQIFCHDPFNHGLRDLFGYPDVTNNPTNLVNLTSSKVCVIRKVDSEIMNSISNNPSEFLFAPSPKRMAPQIPAKKGTGFYSVPRQRCCNLATISQKGPIGKRRNYLDIAILAPKVRQPLAVTIEIILSGRDYFGEVP